MFGHSGIVDCRWTFAFPVLKKTKSSRSIKVTLDKEIPGLFIVKNGVANSTALPVMQ
jgi:hypothetical protein